MQITEISNQHYSTFVERVAANGVVWGLKSDAGWAVSPSNDVDDVTVYPFWSDRAYASRAARDEWAVYEPTPIALELFLANWVTGMQRAGDLIGTNWDAGNYGLEVEPAELADAIARQASRAS